VRSKSARRRSARRRRANERSGGSPIAPVACIERQRNPETAFKLARSSRISLRSSGLQTATPWLLRGTWYRKSVQRSEFNTQCKLLLLGHAFDTLRGIAVEFRTHYLNYQSRRGIERLGAKPDGVLRSHQIANNGTLRSETIPVETIFFDAGVSNPAAASFAGELRQRWAEFNHAGAREWPGPIRDVTMRDAATLFKTRQARHRTSMPNAFMP
jgi:hypothetical protein